jgi:hypothetical protein
MRVDEARRDDQTVRLDNGLGAGIQPPDRGDAAAGDADICLRASRPGTVDHRPVADQKIEFHSAPSPPSSRVLFAQSIDRVLDGANRKDAMGGTG